MYQSNSTPSLYTHNALVQCIVQRRKPIKGLIMALLFLCSAVIVPASAQEPVPAIRTTVPVLLASLTPEKYLFIQITWFNNGDIDWFVDDVTYVYEMCQSRRAEYMYAWELKGDHSFVRTVKFICIPKGRLP